MSVSRGKIVDSVKSGKLNGEVVGKEKVSCGNVGDDDAKIVDAGKGVPHVLEPGELDGSIGVISRQP